ncbi:MAG: ectonucleotide pyrophosphatase/phosphodiesterase [Bacteroidales bacterium]
MNKYIFALSLLICSLISFGQAHSNRYVVVLSLDAFRWDYPQIYNTPNLDTIAKLGVSAPFIPCFPSITFPNHYSMATGLHPNQHGIVHNAFYDDVSKQVYKISDRKAVQDPYFYGGEPIWLTAHKQGLRTASFCWVGSEAPIGGYQPTPWKAYTERPSFEARADSVISWLAQPEAMRPQLIMWYFEQPDAISHRQTPFSPQTKAMVERIDSTIGDFLAKAKQLPHFHQIDFIFLGDHGMSSFEIERHVNLADYLQREDFDLVVTGAISHLYLKDKSKLKQELKKLEKIPHCKVWAKEELPKRFKYGSNSRIGDIVLLADSASMIVFTDKFKPKREAAHGYDNLQSDMSAIFRGIGPSFKKGFVSEPMLNLNLYGIIASLLKLKQVPNEGDSTKINLLFNREYQYK